MRFNNLLNICKTKYGKLVSEGGGGGECRIRKGGPTKNPKINKRRGLLFGTGE